jgi:biopolymer transport protein ExbD
LGADTDPIGPHAPPGAARSTAVRRSARTVLRRFRRATARRMVVTDIAGFPRDRTETAMATTYADTGSPLASINVTPLVDVMLVLLIIFMITTPLVAHQVTIDLPQVVPPPQAPPPPVEPERVTLAADGTLTWNGVTLPAAALEPQLADVARRTPQPMVELSADAATEYQRVADLLAKAKQAGVAEIGFAALDAN